MDRAGHYLLVCTAPGAVLPATSLTLDGQPDGEGRTEALAQAALAGLTLDSGAAWAGVVDQLLLLALPLPVSLDAATGMSAGGASAPDAVARAESWLALAAMEAYVRFPAPARYARAAELVGAVRARVVGGRVSVGSTALLRESALAGLVCLNAGRALGDAEAHTAGFALLLSIVGTFRTGEAPFRWVAAVGGGLASDAPDGEGVALTGLLALGYDVPNVPEQAALALAAYGARSLAGESWAEVSASPYGASGSLDVRGISGGELGRVSATATLLAALLWLRLGEYARGAALFDGLSGARHGHGPLSHALREAPHVPALSLAPSVMAEALYETAWILP